MGVQGTPSVWRKDMLKILNQMASQGVTKVTWEACNDEHTCHLCSERNGVAYTIAEAKEQLKGKFCKPDDPDDRCRCTFTALEFKTTHSRSNKNKKNNSSNLVQFILLVIVALIILKMIF